MVLLYNWDDVAILFLLPLMQYYSDQDPVFQCYETEDLQLNLYDITQGTEARYIHCLVHTGCHVQIPD